MAANGPSTRRAAGGSTPKEFYVSAELYLSKTAVAMRRPPMPRKKTEKRESIRTPSGPADVSQKRIKEKSSWLSLSRNSSGVDQWWPATCKLEVEESGCLLNVYMDETMLYQSVYIHMLNHTDIRHVHRSLFERKDCLGIFCVAGQTWSPTSSTEPLYLHFSDSDVMNAWLALLRSYAMPEIYGRWLSASDGGLYRMWRQVELTCLQGRNIGNSRAFADDSPNGDADKPDSDPSDIDVYCEIYVNGCLSGRTTVKKGIGSPDWHESFTFTDLPPFETLELVLWREKRLLKPVIIGSITLFLMNYRRGELVDGWFPVLNGQSHTGIQVGEMRLKMRVDEEIILPYAAYSALLKTLHSRNYLDWLTELEGRFKSKGLSDHIIPVAIAKNALMDNIMELADREVDGDHSSHNTLFRGNTVFTKTVESFMAWYGSAFLEASVGPVIRRLCSERIAIEVDPVRSGKSTKGLERNAETLVYWCQEFWKCIYDARRQCPNEMRKLFEHIRKLVEKRYRDKDDQNRDLPWQSVSSFLFLRFLVPAILHPHLFGIWPGLTDEPVQRSLTLIAKVIQSLANIRTTVKKEEFMRTVKDFLASSSHAMIDYILVVSTPDTDHKGPPSSSAPDRHEKIRIMSALHHRRTVTPVLHREAVPLIPHLVDVPKHLAVVASLVVRYSRREALPSASQTPEDKRLQEFCSKCLEVEEQALRRVGQLASKQRRQDHRTSPKSPLSQAPLLPASPSSPIPIPTPPRERKRSFPGQRRRSKLPERPTTAPGRSTSRSREARVESPPSSPRMGSSLSRMLSRNSFSSKITVRRSDDNIAVEPHSLPLSRAPFAHHPRSASTDSALLREKPSAAATLITSPISQPVDPAIGDILDDGVKKRKGLLRGILVRR